MQDEAASIVSVVDVKFPLSLRYTGVQIFLHRIIASSPMKNVECEWTRGPVTNKQRISTHFLPHPKSEE